MAAQPQRRRGAEAHRHQGRHRRLRVVARQHAAGAGRERSRPSATTPRRSKAGRGRPSRPSSSTATTSSAITSGYLGAPARSPVPLRHRDEEGRADHERRLRRSQPLVVARRHADRVCEQARQGPRSQQRHATSSSSTPRPARRRRQLTTFRARTEAGRRGALTARPSPTCRATSRALLRVQPGQAGRHPGGRRHAALLTESLDRAVSSPVWRQDGKIDLRHRRRRSRRIPRAHSRGRRHGRAAHDRPPRRRMRCRWDRTATLRCRRRRRSAPNEVYAVEAGQLRKLTAQNDAGRRTVAFASSRGRRRSPPATAPSSTACLPRPAARTGRTEAAADPLDSWRPERPGRSLVRQRCARSFAANGYAVLQVNYRGELGPRLEVPEGDLRRLGQPGSRRSAGRRRLGDQERRRGSGSARHRRLELRRHPHRLHDRDRPALQGGELRRRQRAAALDVRHRTSTSCSTRPSWGRPGRTRTSGSR